ncbi:MAG: ABC transporter substrate-binding protein [Christensenellales bacterium]|jgi:peptide/nickel transport system substrate-binding protein
MKSNILKIIAAALSVLMLTSCAVLDRVETTAGTTTPVPSPQATEQPVTGGELRSVMPAGIESMDPIKADTRELASMLWLIYESPIRLDEAGKPAPELCESWEVEADGTWVFRVRENVTWHGGGALTANDIAHSIQRIIGVAAGDTSNTPDEDDADGDNGDEEALTSGQNGGSKGTASNAPLYKSVAEAIESYSVRDDMTLAVKPKTSGYSLLYAMTFPVVPKTAAGLYSGTGPYVVESYEAGGHMRLVVNDKWWKSRPYIDSIYFTAVKTHDEELMKYSDGEVDMINSSLLHSGRYRGIKGTTIMDMQSQVFDYLLPNLNDPILKNILVRQAIASALDKREIISKAVYSHAITADSPISANSWLYNGTASEFVEHDLMQAQSFLEQAGWTDRNGDPKQLEAMGTDGKLQTLHLRLLVSENADNPIRHEAAYIIADQLERVGFSVEVVAKPWDEFTLDVQNGNFQLALTGVYLSTMPDFRFMLGSGGDKNVGGYSSPKMDAVLSSIIEAEDETSFKAAVSEMQLLVNREIPIIGLYFRCNTLVYRNKVRGIYGLRDIDYTRQVDKWYIVEE